MHLHETSVTISGVRLSLYRGGIRSVAWWVTAGLGVAVLALNVAGELELGIAGRSTVFYLVWMGVWTAIGLFVWAVRPDLRLTGPLWAWSGVLHMNENLLVAMPDSRFVVTETLLLLGMGATVQVNWALVYPAGGSIADSRPCSSRSSTWATSS